MTDQTTKHMVDRFLGWKLPEDFSPDGGISFDPVANKCSLHEYRHQPIGTNLFSADQAEAMVRHMLEGLQPKSVDAVGVAPIEIILTCPSCGGRHIDEREFATKVHHTHACQHCGMVWRPAIMPTVGVQFLPGFKNGE